MNLLLNVVIFLLTVVFLGLGGILLLAGRKFMWILLGAAGFLITATLAAEILGLPNSLSLVEEGKWISLLIAVGVGALGVYVSQNYEHLSIDIIGFAVGVYVATWFDEILLVLNGQDKDDFTWWVALIYIAAGIISIWVTRQDPEQALILISVIIGARTISEGLNMDQSKNITAVMTLGLGLTGVVAQYASYLRERPRLGQRLPPVPHPISEDIPYE